MGTELAPFVAIGCKLRAAIGTRKFIVGFAVDFFRVGCPPCNTAVIRAEFPLFLFRLLLDFFAALLAIFPIINRIGWFYGQVILKQP